VAVFDDVAVEGQALVCVLVGGSRQLMVEVLADEAVEAGSGHVLPDDLEVADVLVGLPIELRGNPGLALEPLGVRVEEVLFVEADLGLGLGGPVSIGDKRLGFVSSSGHSHREVEVVIESNLPWADVVRRR